MAHARAPSGAERATPETSKVFLGNERQWKVITALRIPDAPNEHL
jgi:hypothetical protein